MKIEIKDNLKVEFEAVKSDKNTHIKPNISFEEFIEDAVEMELAFAHDRIVENRSNT